MRHYANFTEAFNEIARDLKELGETVQVETWQGKDVRNDPSFLTYELRNYTYRVPVFDEDDQGLANQIHPTLPWANLEFIERTQGYGSNPGEAWKTREDVWAQHLRPTRQSNLAKFDYTYSERLWFRENLLSVVDKLAEEPNTRQAFIPIFFAEDVGLSKVRVPCSLGYHFLHRSNRLHVTYMERSCDFVTHMRNDVYLACLLLLWVLGEVNQLRSLTLEQMWMPGDFTHFISSLHVFEKDVADVF